MRFVLRYDFRNPARWARPPAQLYARILEQIEWAEQAGFDGVTLSEHHFTDDGFLPSILPMAAAIAARTSRIRIGSDLLLLPLHHPVRVAEDGAVVDILSNGRFELTVGAGYREEEYRGFGARIRQRPGRMEEAVEIVKRCWTEDRFSFVGRYYEVHDVAMTPKPVQRPRPPILLGASSEAAARRAARIADGLRPTTSALWDAYYDELERIGHPAAVRRVPAPRPMFLHVTEDPERDWPRIEDHARYETDVYQSWRHGDFTPYRSAASAADIRSMGIYRVVTPDDAIGILREIRAVHPDDTFSLQPMIAGMDPDVAQASLELFASAVMPELRR
jgi:alkanesulfonate monooxygenase SsuD/methylene tetrahydromethanopterin reductase-like flavin-dependent oxidoreductase (luciferase family)